MILTRESPQQIVLETSRTPATILFLALLIANISLWAFFPSLLVARMLLGFAILWSAFRGLERHRLLLNIDLRTYQLHRGWFFKPPTREGIFDEIAAIAIESNDSQRAEASRLRSRLIVLEFADWEDGGSFVLGFPMGPKVAAEKAADYARRLGAKLIDRTADPEPIVDPSIESS